MCIRDSRRALHVRSEAKSNATHLPVIEKVTSDVMRMGGDVNSANNVSSGGMATKLVAAQIATQAGCYMCIMNGEENHPIARLKDNIKCSWFKPVANPRDARRQWIGGILHPKGIVTIDDGAANALKHGKSLLAAGVQTLSGEFAKGDAVIINGPTGQEIARGLIAYDYHDALKILGRNSADIAHLLGYDKGAVLVHRDNMVQTNI